MTLQIGFTLKLTYNFYQFYNINLEKELFSLSILFVKYEHLSFLNINHLNKFHSFIVRDAVKNME
jgi:hypothetical protein